MFDPIDLVLYVSTRLQGDNDWLVNKLAEMESVRSSQQELIKEQYKKDGKVAISDEQLQDSIALLK